MENIDIYKYAKCIGTIYSHSSQLGFSYWFMKYCIILVITIIWFIECLLAYNSHAYLLITIFGLY
jgi:hypothetical protein